MLKWLLGYYRLSVSALIVGFGGTLIILTSPIKIKIKEYRPSMWILLGVARALLFVLRIDVNCDVPEKFRRHDGFVFPNHVSYVDILVLVSIAPQRFLAKAEVRDMPLIGLIAQTVGCVFVQREDKRSRAAARAALADVDTYPPVVLFPEGKRGAGDRLLPFRYGAFEIVIQGEKPFLLCTIEYDPLEIAIWHRGESIVKALFRLASYDQPIASRLTYIDTIRPSAGADPVQMSEAMHTRMTAVLFPTE